MQLHQLRYVVQVSGSGSFSEAAKELFIAQPSLSQQIIKLEKELGVKLFERRLPAVTLTAAGREFVEIAQKILSDINHLEERMLAHQKDDERELRVGIVHGWSYPSVLQRILTYQQTKRGVILSMTCQSPEEIQALLLEKRLDCAIYQGNEEDLLTMGLWCKPIQFTRLIAAVPKNNLLSRRVYLEPNDLRGQRMFMPPPTSLLCNAIVSGLNMENIHQELLFIDLRDRELLKTGISFFWEGTTTPDLLEDFTLVLITSSTEENICFVTWPSSVQRRLIQELLEVFLHTEHFTGQSRTSNRPMVSD